MPALETRRLGRTEMRCKALALGCASLGRTDRSDREAVSAVRAAIELGIDFFDTSPLYGESERRIGLALEGGWREKVYVQTKTGTHPKRQYDFSAEATRWSVQNSLKLLKTEYLDAVLIHDPSDVADPLAPGRALDELLKMKQEGIVRHIGLGVREHEFHRRAIETGHIELILSYLDYTLLDQSLAQTTLPLARRHDVGVQLGGVLAMGLLTGKEPENHPRAHAMWQWCRARGISLRQLALYFCLAPRIDGIVLVGCGTQEHVEEVYREATTVVPDELWRDFKDQFGVAPQTGMSL
jgi:aryl-alcohol dehydrogenase-like predicted oxidoreductase